MDCQKCGDTLSESTSQSLSTSPSVSVATDIAINGLLGLGGILGGFVVQVLTAKYFGASPDMDAFLVAYLLLFFLQSQLQSGGIVASAFIPSYTSALREGAKEARSLFSTAFVVAALLGLCVTLTCLALSANILRFVGEGLSLESARVALISFRLLSLLVVPLILTALLCSTLRAEGHFVGAASGPLAINCSVTVAIIFLVARLGIMSYVWGVILGCAVQLALVSRPLVIYPMVDLRLLSWRDPRLWVPLKAISVLTLDVAVGLLLLALERNIASTLGPGTVSQMNYAKSLYTLPLRLTVTPAQVVMFSLFAAHAAAGRIADLKIASAKAQDLLVFLMLPTTIVVMCLGNDIVRLIYERGQFSAGDTAATAKFLGFYALSIPALALWWQLRTVSFALNNVALPFLAGALALAVFYVSSKVLLTFLGAPALALSWGIAYYAASLALGAGLTYYYRVPTWGAVAKRLVKLSPAVIAAFACIRGVQRLSMIPEGAHDPSWLILSRIAAYAGAGVGAYFVIAWTARVEEVWTIGALGRDFVIKMKRRLS